MGKVSQERINRKINTIGSETYEKIFDLTNNRYLN